MSKINKAFVIISNEGLISFLKKIFVFVSAKICRVKHLLIFELNIGNYENIISPATELTYRLAEEEDIELMDEEKYNYDRKGKQFSIERLKKGDICALAIYKDEISGYFWMMNKYMELSQDNYITISSDRVYIYKGWVIREMRGKRVFNGISNYLINVAKKNNKRAIVKIVSVDNKPSIKASKRLGFKVVGDIFQIRILGIKYDYIPRKDLEHLQGAQSVY